MTKTKLYNYSRSSFLLVLVLSIVLSCTPQKDKIQKVDEIDIPFTGKSSRMKLVNFDNKDCICVEDVSQSNIKLRIYDLNTKDEVLNINHPNPFNWFLRSAIKDHLIFNARNGNFIIFDLKHNKSDTLKSSDIGINNRNFFDLFANSTSESIIYAKFGETIKAQEMSSNGNHKNAYKLLNKESLLVKLIYNNNKLIKSDTISYGFGGKYIFRNNGFGMFYYHSIDEINEDEYILTSPYSDSIYFINKNRSKAIKVNSKLKDISVDIVPFSYYDRNGSQEFTRKIVENQNTQSQITEMRYNKTNHLIYLLISENGINNNKINMLVMNTSGKTLDETSIDISNNRSHYYYNGKQYFIKEHNYEKDSTIHIDIYQYTTTK